jgi:hypothetical protein
LIGLFQLILKTADLLEKFLDGLWSLVFFALGVDLVHLAVDLLGFFDFFLFFDGDFVVDVYDLVVDFLDFVEKQKKIEKSKEIYRQMNQIDSKGKKHKGPQSVEKLL